MRSHGEPSLVTASGWRVARGRRALVVALASAGIAALCLGACGGSSGGGTEGGTLRGTFASFPDYLDPGLSYSLEGWSAMWNTYVPLLTYAHTSGTAGTRIIPGLARSLPKISDGGRTYTLSLRPGLRYSDGSLVRASDFRRTIERDYLLNSGGSPFFSDIVGAPAFERTKKGGIPGIQTDDASGKIVIHLIEPSGTFVNDLASLFAAPVPGDTPAEDLSADPPPATGPYEIASSHPGRGWEYRRNPEWSATNSALMPELPSGHFDRIEIEVMRNQSTQVNEVENGHFAWMENPLPADRFPELKRRYEGTQLLITPQIDVYYFWMNTAAPPFDDPRVRRAVNYALDPRALERIYAGQLRSLQQVLPETMPGHRTFELYPHDMAKARALIAAADPSVRDITVWTDDSPANKEATEYYADVLSELGFEPTLKVVSADNYFTVIGNLSTPDLDTGWANWFLDYPHPNDYFQPQLAGSSIQPTHNSNWARFDDPAVNRRIAELGAEPLDPKLEAAYAGLDREVMEAAPWAPYGTLSLSTFVASTIDLEKLVVNPIYGQDLTSFQRR